MHNAYSKFDKSNFTISAPSSENLTYLLRILLENNIFEFNGKVYKQLIGCAMGNKCSPSVIDTQMYEITNEIIEKFQHKNKILYHARYRDDGIILFNGTKEEILNFFEIANSHHRLIKFTYEILEESTTFLDITVFKGERFNTSNILDVKTHFKPTNTFQYLNRTSAHNSAVFKAFIKGEAIRQIRNTNNNNSLQKTLSEFKRHLLKREYNTNEIETAINEASMTNRSTLLKSIKTKEKKKKIPLVFVTKYNPSVSKLRKKLIKN